MKAAFQDCHGEQLQNTDWLCEDADGEGVHISRKEKVEQLCMNHICRPPPREFTASNLLYLF